MVPSRSPWFAPCEVIDAAYASWLNHPMARAWWQGSGAEFAAADKTSILGALADSSPFPDELAQKAAWRFTIDHLATVGSAFPMSHIFLEFSIPRMGRRADAVVVAEGLIFVVEYKVGATEYARSALDQTHGYALDLKNFHSTSRDLPIVPVLVATSARPADPELGLWPKDRVHPPIATNADGLLPLLQQFVRTRAGPPIDARSWAAGAYEPTPTIIEAAQALYRGHNVAEISRSGAEEKNLSLTTGTIDRLVAEARSSGNKAICFVTGVPGAGKTLVGLNLACRHMDAQGAGDATYLSGNGPLVKVLRRALLQDWKARTTAPERRRKAEAAREASRVEALVQNVHNFRDEALANHHPPTECLVVFDEAQRAWDRAQTNDFMRRKRKQTQFDQSEPAFLLGVMDRKPGWCVVVCLVGEGQEINKGEAGISEWLDALAADFRHWNVHLPPRLLTPEFGVSRELAYRAGRLNPATDASLHLDASVRSFRAREVADFIASILDDRLDQARRKLEGLKDYPIVRTRDLGSARTWLRSRRRGPERSGILASSNALRLIPTCADADSSRGIPKGVKV
jgi:hypothetical protein